MSIKDKIAKANNSEYAKKSGDWFKFKEGDNTIRILTEPEILYEDFKLGICYTDCGFQGSVKGLVYILDRADGCIKLMKLSYNLLQQLESYESDSDYGFSGFPMPYDITVKAEKAGTKEVKYTYLPRPVKEVEQKIINDLAQEKPCAEVIDIMKEKNIEKHKADGTWDRIRSEQEAIGKEINDAVQKAPADDVPTIEYPENDSDIPFPTEEDVN